MLDTWIVDTNVLVAGLIGRSDSAPPARLLQAALGGKLRIALSAELLTEYSAVLSRPALMKLHRLSGKALESLLTHLTHRAVLLSPPNGSSRLGHPRGPRAPDPGDQMLWDLLAQHERLLLVTGDKLLMQDALMGGRVLTPAQACERTGL